MRKYAPAIVGLVLLCLVAAPGTATASPDTVIVDSTTDVKDGDISSISNLIATPGGDGVISLREAIEAANNTPGSDYIEFNIPLADPGYMVSGIAGTWTIALTASLPTLSGGGTFIRGDTQAVNVPASTNPNGPEIEINGLGMAAGSCFEISSANNVIRVLVINRCKSSGIDIRESSASTNTISGNYIGTDVTGSSDLGNSSIGVYIFNGAQNNLIGGDTSEERNIISGNDLDGVRIYGSGTNGNTISGNYIGTDATGSSSLGNSGDGVHISNGSQNNVIGGDTPGERNIISGNDMDGVLLQDSGTMSNTVSGNYIGTNAAGSSGLGNSGDGVEIFNGAENNTIGGDSPEERNIISGNNSHGVAVSHTGTNGNTISGNYIGTDATGSSGLGNSHYGVVIEQGAQNNVIGGDASGERNVISGSGWGGVNITGSETTSNTISGNYIGTDATGSSGPGNSGHGVTIQQGAQNNVIGGGASGESNIIAFNGQNGVYVSGATTTGSTITQNSIHSNTLLGIDNWNGGNTELSPPAISGANVCFVMGTAGAGYTVEVFTGPDEEGKTYLATASADGGLWSVVGPFAFDIYVTATATDASGNTSEFSAQATPGGACHQSFLPLTVKNY